MPEKERQILLNINEQLKKLNQPPAPTFSPQSGEDKEKALEQLPSNPLVSLPQFKQ